METGIGETAGEAKAAGLPVVGVQYLGDGTNYVEGVPARGLTREEWQAVSADLKALALATGLYHDPLAGSEPVKSDGRRRKANAE